MLYPLVLYKYFLVINNGLKNIQKCHKYKSAILYLGVSPSLSLTPILTLIVTLTVKL